MSDDLRTQVRKWFVETGYVDGGGVGYWDSTEESVEVGSEDAANALRDEWLKQGKLIRTRWGELRPTFSYGIFRIRSIWVDVPNPLTDRIEQLVATCEELEAKLAELLAVAKRAVRLSLDHSDFKLYAMEPMHQAIAAAELKGQKDE